MNSFILLILIILIFASLIISVISLSKNNNESFAGSVLNVNECYNSNFDEEQTQQCIKQVNTLTSNINSQYWGQPGNRGITYPGGPSGGSFGNPYIL